MTNTRDIIPSALYRVTYHGRIGCYYGHRLLEDPLLVKLLPELELEPLDKNELLLESHRQ